MTETPLMNQAGRAISWMVMMMLLGTSTTQAAPPQADAKAPALRRLPVGAIKPTGWLKHQLRAQADGLTGKLDEFWPDIKDSAWFGGNAEGWERVPYWLDGLIPLAFQLDDAGLQAKAKRAIDYILEHQNADGWLGPVGDNNPRHKPYDVWPLFPLFKALIQYQEATGDPRIIPALQRCAAKIDAVISNEPLYSWAHFRAADFAFGLLWLYEKTNDPALLEIARKALAQAYDWRAHFERFEDKYTEKTTEFGLDNHGVNNGMALKFGPVRWRLTQDPADLALATLALSKLDRYHGQATGMFTCDEHYAGRSPSQGTELCTVVEAMFSLQLAIEASANAPLADRLERIAYNALPATFKKDMTAHQYDQQCNQVICTRDGDHVYTNNGPDSNLYGLEPNFGCCTANMHQGWPKFVSGLWMATPDDGLAAVVYAPCVIETKAGGAPVQVEVQTPYPFGDGVNIVVRQESPARFPLHLRFPEWSSTATLRASAAGLSVDGQPLPAESDVSIQSNGSARFLKVEGQWPREIVLSVRFDQPIKLVRGFNDSVSITRGPLVFALPIKGEWRKVKDRSPLPFHDWEVFPAEPWNFALELDPAEPVRSLKAAIDFTSNPGAFDPSNQAITITTTGRLVPEWGIESAAAAPPPQSPVTTNEPPRALKLIPYGCTDLRVTEFPLAQPR